MERGYLERRCYGKLFVKWKSGFAVFVIEKGNGNNRLFWYNSVFGIFFREIRIDGLGFSLLVESL